MTTAFLKHRNNLRSRIWSPFLRTGCVEIDGRTITPGDIYRLAYNYGNIVVEEFSVRWDRVNDQKARAVDDGTAWTPQMNHAAIERESIATGTITRPDGSIYDGWAYLVDLKGRIGGTPETPSHYPPR